MNTQEIRITAQITLEVPIELSKSQLVEKFDCANLEIWSKYKDGFESYKSHLDIIEIEEEAEIYGTEDQ